MSDIWKKTKENISKAFDKTIDASEDVWDKTREIGEETWDKAKNTFKHKEEDDDECKCDKHFFSQQKDKNCENDNLQSKL